MSVRRCFAGNNNSNWKKINVININTYCCTMKRRLYDDDYDGYLSDDGDFDEAANGDHYYCCCYCCCGCYC